MKNTNNMILRSVNPNDSESILKIYAPYIKYTAITCECNIPSIKEFTQRIIDISNSYPYIVAEMNGEIVGYAYANSFNSRYAFRFSVETSIYVSEDNQKLGIGTLLYNELEKQLKAQGVKNLYANVVCCDRIDEHISNGSIVFHQKFGYNIVGKLTNCAYKFEKWYNTVFMEKII